MATQTRHRRRGDELESAILTAAWDELRETGFAGLTMESVAARARTGVAVLYRRWANKEELVLAAIRQYADARRVEIPDTGNLRDDLLALLASIGERRTMFTTVVAAAFSGLMANTGRTPAQVREELMGDRPLWSDAVFRRAHERGEIDLDRISPDVLALPFDLIRHDLLMTHKPPSRKRIVAIIDDLFLPLVRSKG